MLFGQSSTIVTPKIALEITIIVIAYITLSDIESDYKK
jgi:hypothetical protein